MRYHGSREPCMWRLLGNKREADKMRLFRRMILVRQASRPWAAARIGRGCEALVEIFGLAVYHLPQTPRASPLDVAFEDFFYRASCY